MSPIKYIIVLILKNHFKDKNIDIFELRRKILNTNNEIYRLYLFNSYNKMLAKANAFIPINAYFEEKPIFPHYIYGIFISNGAKIGKNCTIFHQVTIGSNTLADSKRRGVPSIGDNVFIGCGAKIIGNVKIGNNVRIGANCIVTQDIPDNATVVLQSSKIILHNDIRNNCFITYSDYKKELII